MLEWHVCSHSWLKLWVGVGRSRVTGPSVRTLGYTYQKAKSSWLRSVGEPSSRSGAKIWRLQARQDAGVLTMTESTSTVHVSAFVLEPLCADSISQWAVPMQWQR